MFGSYDRDDTYIKGITDDSKIGNVADKLKVHGEFSSEYVDVFNRLRISLPTNLFEQHHRNGKNALYWDESITGSASSTHNANKSSVELNTTTASGDKIIRQTYRYLRYFPGKSQSVYMTGNFVSTQTNVRKRLGYFDASDGLFWQLDGSTFSVVKRSSVSGSPVDTVVNQASWNIDIMDGSGPSGETFDVTKQNIFIISFQWLGSGTAVFSLSINGIIRPVHAFHNANILTVPYSNTGDLPIRVELENTAAPSSGGEMHITCFSVMSDGGTVELGRIWAFGSGITETTISSETALFAYRLKSSYLRYSLKPLVSSFIMTTSTSAAVYRFYLRPTISATWTSVNAESITEYALNPAISSWSGGTKIDEDFIASGGNKQAATATTDVVSDIFLGSSIGGTADVLLVTGESVSGNNKLLCAHKFREYF
jgi:hypothetical protein